MIGSLIAVFLVLLTRDAGRPPSNLRLFTDATLTTYVDVSNSDFGYVGAVGFDDKTKRLYNLSRESLGVQLKAWDLSGKLLFVTKIESGYELRSCLYRVDGHLRFTLTDQINSRLVICNVSEANGEIVMTPLTESTLKDDDNLAPSTRKKILDTLTKLNWSPAPLIGVHLDDLRRLIPITLVNARSTDNLLDWSSGMGVIAIAWKDGPIAAVNIAVTGKKRKLVSTDIQRLLLRLQEPRDSVFGHSVKGLAVTKDMVAVSVKDYKDVQLYTYQFSARNGEVNLTKKVPGVVATHIRSFNSSPSGKDTVERCYDSS